RKTAATKAKTQAKSTAKSEAAEVKGTVETVSEYAEKAVLVPVGAALIGRDKLVATVEDLRASYGTRAAAEKELKARQKKLETQLKKFERRGTTARNKVEREVKKTRTQVERELRQRRTRFEREVKKTRTQAEKELKAFRADLEKQAQTVTKDLNLGDVQARAEFVTARVENLVQTGVTAGQKAGKTVQERVASLV
uniref:hypothetical protein n=1 Tax=Paraconexibacter sp. TaxID=2949640 RepID=UPI003568C839